MINRVQSVMPSAHHTLLLVQSPHTVYLHYEHTVIIIGTST